MTELLLWAEKQDGEIKWQDDHDKINDGVSSDQEAEHYNVTVRELYAVLANTSESDVSSGYVQTTPN